MQLKVLIGLAYWVLGSTLVWANSLESIRVLPEKKETRVVIDLKEEASYTYFTITESKPFRLVIDLKDTELAMSLPQKITNSKILTKIRKSRPSKEGSFRLVFELKDETSPSFSLLPPTKGSTHGLIVDLPHAEMPLVTKIEKINKEQPPSAIAQKEPAKVPSIKFEVVEKLENNYKVETALPFGKDDIVIAIDPGHGGIDPGAVGSKRKYEKHITLAIARDMAEMINSVRGMKAVLTREGDYFVDLNKRSDLARRYGAHFLISIHADGFPQPEPRGASVWVLSKTRANSEIGRWIERHEKQSELLGGGSVVQQYQDEHLSRALLDLQFNNSHKEGYNVAVEVLEELGKVTHLHKTNPEYASLAVLKAPDIPSILVEAGFITNPNEEALLLTRSYQEKIAKAVYRGVRSYFERFPPDGTLFAAMKNGVMHKVKNGESLSVIAEKYGVAIEDIMRNNNLNSKALKTSQELIIFEAAPKQASSQLYDNWIKYVVKYGDYLGKIASSYGVSINAIRNVNRLSSDMLEIGQVLIIPGS